MKNFKIKTTRNILLITIAAIMLFYFSSCSKKIFFQTSLVVPAAEGAVNITKGRNDNYKIKISLSNLAEPARLQPAKSIYVVWMETEDKGTKNIGQIKSSAGFLSGKLKAKFETVSAFKPVKIFITAEDDAGIQYPGMQVVLSTNNF